MLTWNTLWQTMGPELVLMLGACVTLFLGVIPAGRQPATIPFVGFVTLGIAALLTFMLRVPEDQAMLLPGIWITPLTFYVRVSAITIGALILLANWSQAVAEERGEYISLLLLSILGVLVTASANDLLVLFFAIELVSVPTYVLVAFSRQDSRAAEAAVKYFFLGAMAAAVLAYGLTFLYGATGTTTLFRSVNGVLQSPLAGMQGSFALAGLILVLAGLAFKIAAVPFHAYVADVYEGAASPITGMLGFVPKFAGFIALMKIMSAFAWQMPDGIFWLVWLMAAATMTAGNTLALLQDNIKRTLAYSSVAHSGYMLLGLLAGPLAGDGPMSNGASAVLFYMVAYGVMNLGVFVLLSSLKASGRDIETLDDISGIARRHPLIAIALGMCVFSLMGFPLTAGFVGKIYLFSSALSVGADHPHQAAMVALVVIAVINSAIAAAYYLRIMAIAVMGKEIDPCEPVSGAPQRLSLVVCCVAVLVGFFYPGQLMSWAQAAVPRRSASPALVAMHTPDAAIAPQSIDAMDR